jgi:phosphatidylserine decarboxylase
MAKEGLLFVIIPIVLGLALLLLKIPYVSFPIAIFLYMLAGYFAFFFRDPQRVITAKSNEIVSPVDGTVLDIIEEKDEYRIVVFLSVFDVHVARLPYQGRIEKILYNKGKFLPAFREKASELNEQIVLDVAADSFQYKLRLIAGIAARRIRMWVKEGVTLGSGEKIGIILFGSRAEIHLPKTVQLTVKVKQKITGGLTLIAKILNPA